jgi:ABC-2 type transport system ATP-binding protein
VAYIYFSRLIADGAPETLKKLPEVTPPGTHRVEISAPELTRALRAMRELPVVRSATVFGQAIHALVDEQVSAGELQEYLKRHGVVITEVRPLAPSLEDVFVQLTYKHQEKAEMAHA